MEKAMDKAKAKSLEVRPNGESSSKTVVHTALNSAQNNMI
jgi:hypothetical protein